MKVFIDTNVWVAAHAGSGLCAELLIFVNQRHQLLCSTQVLREFEDVIVRKLRRAPAEAAALRVEIEARCQVQPDPKQAPKRSRDRKDDPVVQAALEADAEWLVTGDADLLVLKRVEGMPISTPRDFLEALGVEEPWD